MGEGGGGEEKAPFHFHLSPFPQETPDTQAILAKVSCMLFMLSAR